MLRHRKLKTSRNAATRLSQKIDATLTSALPARGKLKKAALPAGEVMAALTFFSTSIQAGG
jgi:hypothetical protein